MKFKILGPIEVEHENRAIHLGGPRQRAVLARLLVVWPHAVGRDQLIDDVWAGEPPTTAAKTLQKYVSELRKLLGAATVRTVGAAYALDVDDTQIDAANFEALIDATHYDEALDLWRGEPLGDLVDLPFTLPHRARLGELRVFGLERVVDEYLARTAYADVIALSSQLVDEYPLHERFCAQRMLALYRSGRQVEALRAYEAHRLELAEAGLTPSSELRQLEAAVVRHDPSLQPAPESLPTTGNLRRPLGTFVGRVDERIDVAKALDENRLVTLTGPGGVGKTRLGVEVLADTAHVYEGGVWFIDLAGVSSPGLVGHTVATALGLNDQPDQSDADTVAAALCRRPQGALLLDNCEHVAEACARFAEQILHRCPHATILATSRRPLGVDGELVAPVGPLDDESAAELFSDRARRAGNAVPNTADDNARVRELCRALDGLPLAIELCASQLRVLGTAGMLERLDDRLRFAGRQSGAPARHRTLRDMVEWSHELLEPASQRIFARLGVFPATFSLNDAEALCDDADTLTHLGILIDHSLLVPDPCTNVHRYRMLDTLRLFAIEQLQAAGAVDDVRRAHACQFLDLARRSVYGFYGPDELAWADRITVEEPNIHAALCWAREHDPKIALELAINLWPYWDFRWHERKALDYLDPILERHDLDVPDATRAWALTVAADLGANPGEARIALRRAREAVAMFRARSDDVGIACALVALGSAYRNQGSLDRATAALDEALIIAGRVAVPMLQGRVLHHRSSIAMQRGDYAAAVADITSELWHARRLGSRRSEALALRQLAAAHWHLGDLERAVEACLRALDLWRGLGDDVAAAHARMTLADIAAARGNIAVARPMYEDALRVVQSVGDQRCTASIFKNLGLLAVRRAEHECSVGLFVESLTIRHQLGDDAGLAECLDGLAGALAAHGRAEDGVVLLGAAQARRDVSGSVRAPQEAVEIEAAIAVVHRALGDRRFQAAYAEGWSQSVDEAVQHALVCAQAVGQSFDA